MVDINITYFEDLTGTGYTCPPVDAVNPDGKKEFFRVVKYNPATDDCFVSHRKKFPERVYSDECIARAVSIYDTLEGLMNGFIKTPAGKKKKRLIGAITLKPNDGHLKNTFSANHYSWWRSTVFNPSVAVINQIEL